MTVCYEPVTGSPVGPGPLALLFFGAEAEKGAARVPQPVPAARSILRFAVSKYFRKGSLLFCLFHVKCLYIFNKKKG